MKSKLVNNLSVNSLQLIFNQLFGLVIFYILSTTLNKTDFGQINFSLAILLAAFNIFSLGIDQLVVKKVAAGESIPTLLQIYIFHVLFTGFLFYAALIAVSFLFPGAGNVYSVLILIGIGKLMIFFSTPFKQVANGAERFRLTARMSIVSNLIRCVCLLAGTIVHFLNLHTIALIFIAGDSVELLVCIYLFKKNMGIPLSFKWSKVGYINLLRESIPQTGVVLITSALARFDWIFLGIILSAAKLAEYSFAYKIFETATLPLLAIAPLLIPLFTKLFQQGTVIEANLKFLIRIEIIIAASTALLLNICWVPVIDPLTAGKYGTVNVTTIFILSLCMPFLYINNFLWTIYFAQGRLKMILNSFVFALLINIIGDIILIPIYKNEGAAFAFLLSCVAQTTFYLKKNEITQLKTIWQTLTVCICCALCSGIIANLLVNSLFVKVLLAVIIYVVLLFASGQINLSDKKTLSRY